MHPDFYMNETKEREKKRRREKENERDRRKMRYNENGEWSGQCRTRDRDGVIVIGFSLGVLSCVQAWQNVCQLTSAVA